MIRLSRISDYGILLMTQLAARGEQGPCNARELATEVELPLPMASKILKSLARQELLVSHRGTKGGYSLARPPQEISAAEIITALDGPIGLTRCTIHPGECDHEPRCHVRGPWQRINAILHQALSAVTLADLAKPRPPDAVLDSDTIPLSSLGSGAREPAEP